MLVCGPLVFACRAAGMRPDQRRMDPPLSVLCARVCDPCRPLLPPCRAAGMRLDQQWVDRSSWLAPAALAHPDYGLDNIIAGVWGSFLQLVGTILLG